MSREKKNLTEQVEDYFRYRQGHVYHKHSTTIDKDSLWNPPKRRRKVKNGQQ
jgi:hypothetical protein